MTLLIRCSAENFGKSTHTHIHSDKAGIASCVYVCTLKAYNQHTADMYICISEFQDIQLVPERFALHIIYNIHVCMCVCIVYILTYNNNMEVVAVSVWFACTEI